MYDQIVGTRFHVYNSLFLNLPFQNISRTGTLLPLLQQYCEDEFEQGKSPKAIIHDFFHDIVPNADQKAQFDLLFNFIQYVERQIALFDSVEDAAFEQVNDVKGKGTVTALLSRAVYEKKSQDLINKLTDFSLRVVLTAHPTQFYPGHVLGILTDLEKSIRENDLGQVNLLLRQLGKTAFLNQVKPTPYDEAATLCWYLENVFYFSVSDIVRQLAAGVAMELNEWPNDKIIVIGFWPGGDRDGNPFVTSDITVRVAARLKQTILKCYYRDVRAIRRRLTFHGVLPIMIAVEQKIYSDVFGDEKNYQKSGELIADLERARKILLEEHDGLFLELLDAFILKVKLFGFHFACLDIRQDSRKHDAVWDDILKNLSVKGATMDAQKFAQLKPGEKCEYLLNLKIDLKNEKFTDEFTNETIQSIRAIGTIQKENGTRGCHRYIISNCQSALHVVEVFSLAMLLLNEEALELDVIPLFETIDDLANAPAIMEELFSVASYRAHLKKRNNRQTIMLGFSDGTKDGGYLRANWSIYRAKETLTAVARKFGLKAIFFDGRGGPPARGGGNTHDFYASLGDTIENEEVQITIQGQTISSNFGRTASCRYNLEQLISAGLESAMSVRPEARMSGTDKKLMDDLAEFGYSAYLELKHHPKFVDYLEKVTPLSFFGDTNIGSRPVKRSTSGGLKLEDLRAIPFVGSWAMMKQNIPGFYGVGTALKRMNDDGRFEKMTELYSKSLFFKTLLGNSMMSLTKSFYQATLYLNDDPEFSEIWNKMNNEYKLSIEMVLKISGFKYLMENNPLNRESVSLRERIVLPLIAIQQFALMSLRHQKEEDKDAEMLYRKLIIRCMFGIINAARNSA
ncbi:MAG TPA: phosphoenolpyruvate carboxylase [Cyclobacteriaceae bacterium]|nr:phosphoenolpyruvate carboxylase [Cyclobacteriaceae bacterium]